MAFSNCYGIVACVFQRFTMVSIMNYLWFLTSTIIYSGEVKMLNIKKCILLFVAASLILPSLTPLFAEEDPAKALKPSPSEWRTKYFKAGDNEGIRVIQNQHWLMCFLHWKKLTDELKKSHSIDYTKKTMLNFWGEDMPFVLTGIEGETTVAGHKAYWVEGTIYNNSIRTRFLIWNCEESGRQFIADININKSMGTPDDLLEIQDAITRSISCHGQEVEVKDNRLNSRFSSDELGISFSKPADWNTSKFEYKKWYKDGVNRENGSLWTLPEAAEKFVMHVWFKKEKGKVSLKTLSDKLSSLKWNKGPLTYTVNEVKILESTEDSKGIHTGSFNFHSEYKEQKGDEEHLLKVKHWQKGDIEHYLVVTVANRTDVWMSKVDLKPDESVLDSLLMEASALFMK